MTDSIPQDEFMGIFHRLNQFVRLGRVRNHKDIRKRINRILKLQRKASRVAKRPSTRRKYRRDFNHLRLLYRNDIAERIWDEAVENPGGIVDETLDYGYAKAQKRALERSRQNAGARAPKFDLQ